MAWVPMFALPNIHVKEPAATASLALVYADDERLKSLAAAHPNFAAYLKQFSTEFGVTISPSLLMWDDAGPQAYRNTEALAGFRDALALSVVPYSWAWAQIRQKAKSLVLQLVQHLSLDDRQELRVRRDAQQRGARA